jgi:serine/threonine-protein kinase
MWGEGTVLAGRYQLRQRIGGGSMGDVWRALDTVLGREVAVKILLPALLDDAGFAARFRTEARVLAVLSHPGIVSVFDYGQTDDPRTAFLVMELITGRPLSDLLDDSAPLSEATTLNIVAQTLEALQAAHDQGIVHRDVKPANLMLRGGGVVVTDFGVARTADARRLTAADVVLGTAVYAAPEQARQSAVTAAADQYAVGVIAYECLTGAPPFDGGTPLGIMMKHLQEPVPPLPDTVSAPVRDLVMRALAKDPTARFGSAREMAEAARRLAARAASVARIGTPEDSFQTGVDVAAVEAAAAAGVAEPVAARADNDFMSFTVLPREAAAEGEAEIAAVAEPAKAERPEAEEITPPWASYVVRPPAEGEDWASFTVGGTVPLPEGEGRPALAFPPLDGGSETGPQDGPQDAGAAVGPGRMVPQDSFIAGVEVEAAGGSTAAAEGASTRGGAGGRLVLQDSFTAGIAPEGVGAEAASAAEGAEGAETAEAAGAVGIAESTAAAGASGLSSEAGSDAGGEGVGTASRAVPQDSFTAGVGVADLAVGGDGGAERSSREDSFTIVASEDAAAESAPSPPNRRRAIVLTGAAAVVAAVVAVVVAYPLSRSGSSAAAAVAATRSPAAVTSSDSSLVESSSASSSPSSTSSTSSSSATSSSSSSASAKPTSSASSHPSSVVSVPAPSSDPGSTISSMVSRAPSSPVSPPPTSSSSPSVPHKSGYITNVGDGAAIDVYGTSAGAPIYNDGAQLTVEPQAGRTGQTFQATASSANGQTVYEFGDNLDTNQLLDDDGAGSGRISLYHGHGGANQMWWLATDSSLPSGAFYLHNQQFSDCLTDNGVGQAISVKPCVAGNKAQEWYLP